eukprot:CAMPEP_0115154202 /NCGR_PEP_ID=MMETSP0227-20121206/67152_1 /TAXON_ID=89957 /ORGANISM="Polarella glacialis, Strain CCMP 1383" /LENGTH=728 /DNA_ID=CAMNT_0002565029 /DNA_START=38 /DNA_END=2220 /DNA_ORIENTATION=+
MADGGLDINISGFSPAVVRTAKAVASTRSSSASSVKRKVSKSERSAPAPVSLTSSGKKRKVLRRGGSDGDGQPPRKALRRGSADEAKALPAKAKVTAGPIVATPPREAEKRSTKKVLGRSEAVDGEKPKGKGKGKGQKSGASGGIASRGLDAPPSEDRPRGVSTGVVSGTDFKTLKLNENLLRQLEYLNFKGCTPVQAVSVSQAMKGGRDVLLRAPTGSGKTLAFLLPVLHQLLQLPPDARDRSKGTLATILSPTKELALQTLKVASSLVRMVPSLVCGAVAGGENPKSEKARLRKGVSILCATPGRLAYHLEHTETLELKHVRCLVLDEADRLLDMGFEPQVRSIHKRLTGGARRSDEKAGGQEAYKPRAVQTYLVSATLVPAVRQLAEFCLGKNAIWADPEASSSPSTVSGLDGAISVGDELGFSVPDTLTQWYCVVPSRDRLTALMGAILSRVGKSGGGKSSKGKKAIIFFSTGASVDFHCDLLVDATWPSKGGLQRKKDEGPKIKKLPGGFIGLAEASNMMRDDESADDVDESEDEKPGTEQSILEGAGSKIFTTTPVFKLHGSLGPEERAGYIADFSKADGGVLLASDAASRGLDFPQIDWIIQYDPPQRTEEYLHRVGRTARIGRAGNALLFLKPSELGFLDVLRGRGLTNLKEMSPDDLFAGLRQRAAGGSCRPSCEPRRRPAATRSPSAVSLLGFAQGVSILPTRAEGLISVRRAPHRAP